MSKQKNVYVCQECGAESPKWIGRCPSCNNWNTYVEEIKVTGQSNSRLTVNHDKTQTKPLPFDKVETINFSRITSDIKEFDRIIGGGIVPGSFILLGGEPGIGKSTLALQLALTSKKKILYISGEESAGQLKLRAERLNKTNPECLVYNETNLEEITVQIKNQIPAMVIVDSIQTVYTSMIESAPGSVSQVRECAARLLMIAKDMSIPIIIIGHITKDGTLAGPKVLEHIVDTVIQFEGDQHLNFRLLRTLKNRFGPVPELAIFEMGQDGLTEVLNPSAYFIQSGEQNLSGVAIACTVDGYRPLLIEAQALVSNAVYGTPQRSATGFDIRRLNMLLAVLDKKAGLTISNKDVFLNIAGGIKIQDTAADMAVIAAIVSSRTDQPIDSKTCCCAEISLTGELRPVIRIEQRLAEAAKLGFTKLIISAYHKKIPAFDGLEIKKAGTINDALKMIFRN